MKHHKVTDILHPYIPFNDTRGPTLLKTCITSCPSGFSEKTLCPDRIYPTHNITSKYLDPECRRICEPCIGTCEKSCLGDVITSISSIERFKECTVIDGPLEISVRGAGGGE